MPFINTNKMCVCTFSGFRATFSFFSNHVPDKTISLLLDNGFVSFSQWRMEMEKTYLLLKIFKTLYNIQFLKESEVSYYS